MAPPSENLHKYGLQTASEIASAKQDRADARAAALRARIAAHGGAATAGPTQPTRTQRTDLIFERGGQIGSAALAQGFRSDDSFQPFSRGQSPVGHLRTPSGVLPIYRKPDVSIARWDPATGMNPALQGQYGQFRRAQLGGLATTARGVVAGFTGYDPIEKAIRSGSAKQIARETALQAVFFLPGGKLFKEGEVGGSALMKLVRSAHKAPEIMGADRDFFHAAVDAAIENKKLRLKLKQRADISAHNAALTEFTDPAGAAAGRYQSLYNDLIDNVDVPLAHAIPARLPRSNEPLSPEHEKAMLEHSRAQKAYTRAKTAQKNALTADETANAKLAVAQTKNRLDAAKNDALYERMRAESSVTLKQLMEHPAAAERQVLADTLHATYKGRKGALSAAMRTPGLIHEVIGHLDELASAGEHGRMWYENSARDILIRAQGDKEKARRIAQLFAIYSPQQPILGNTSLAFRAYNEFLRTGTVRTGQRWQQKAARTVLSGKGDWNGRKTNNFYLNFLEDIDHDKYLAERVLTAAEKRKAIKKGLMRSGDEHLGEVTSDLWMARAFGHKTDAVSNGRYDVIEAITTQLAKERGWKPKQMQAAIWTAIKDSSDDVSANIDFATGIDRHLAHLNYDVVSASRPELQAAFDSWPVEIQRAFIVQKSAAVDEFINEVGLIGSRGTLRDIGAEVRIGTSAAPRGEKGKVSYTLGKGERSLLNVTASAISRALGGEKATWVRPFKPQTPGAVDTVEALMGRPASREEADHLWHLLNPDGVERISVHPTGRGLDIRNESADLPSISRRKGQESFQSIVKDAGIRSGIDTSGVRGYATDSATVRGEDFEQFVGDSFGKRPGRRGLRFVGAADHLSDNSARIDDAFLADAERAAAGSGGADTTRLTSQSRAQISRSPEDLAHGVAPEPPRLPEDRPLAEVPEETLFHGSPEGDIADVNALHHTQMWREGPGFYLTTSGEKAGRYAAGKSAKAARRTGQGAVSSFRMKQGTRILDMDAQPESFWRDWASKIIGEPVSEETWRSWASDIPTGKMSEGIANRQRLAHILTDYNGMPFTDAYYAIEEAVHDAGYQATLHHEGGVPVYIVKDESVIEAVPPVEAPPEVPTPAEAPPSEPPPPEPPPVAEATPPEPPPGPPSDKQIRADLREATAAAKERKAGYATEFGQRVGEYERLAEEAGGGWEGHLAGMEAMRGPYPKVRFENWTELNDEARDAMVRRVEASDLRSGEKLRAKKAIGRAQNEAKLQPAEIRLLRTVFGEQTAKDLEDVGSGWMALWDIVNVPRALQSSFDLSAVLRQGLVLGVRHPIIAGRNIKPMLAAARSRGRYNELQQQIVDDLYFDEAHEHGLVFTEVGKLGEHEEGFYTKWAEKIPGVSHSARAYTLYLNKLRMDAYKAMRDDAVDAANVGTLSWLTRGRVERGALRVTKDLLGKETKQITEREALESLTSYINNATGRGNLGKFETSAKVLNAFFFSPRLLASRFNLLLNPHWYASQTPYVRRRALRAMMQTVTTGISVLTLAKLAGAEVGLDPRSANFGKIKIGDTRIDIWGGFQPLARYTAQLVTATYISSVSGTRIPLSGDKFGGTSRLDVFLRFMRSKEAPFPSLVTDWMAGKNVVGDKFRWSDQWKRLLPLLAGDAYDVFHAGGGSWTLTPPPSAVLKGLGAYAGGGTGLGIQSYGKAPPKFNIPGGGLPGGSLPSSNLPP